MEKTTKPASSQPQNKTVATNGTTAVAKQKPHEIFKSQLNHYEGTIVKLIQDTGIKPAKFMEMVYTAVRKQPDLLLCDRASLFGSILTAAELGLIPNTPFGYCYIIPYDDNKSGLKLAQFQLGYSGVVQLMYRIPDVEKIESERVFLKDDFDYEIFPKKKILKHKPFKPTTEGENRGPLTAVYCTVKMKNIEEPFFEIVFKEDLDAIQKLSKAGSSKYSPYNNGTDVFNWMQRKVPIKQIFKTMRKETAPAITNKALELEDVLEKGAILKVGEDGKVKISYLEGQEPVQRNKSLDKLIDDVPESEIEPVVVTQEYDMDEDPATQANRQFSSGSFEQPVENNQSASSQEGKLNL